MAVARVAAVVLSYDGRELLDVLLPTLRAQRYRDFSITIVDNGSSDGTAAHVRSSWPEAQLIEIPVNVGVAAALNRGVTSSAGEYVALLNNDLELDPGWLGELVDALDRHPRAASATGKLLNFRRRGEFDAAGDLMRWSGAPDHRGHGEPDRGQYDEPAAVFSPCAGAALYRRDALEAVGPFDEDFFAYMEDIDWGFRAQLAGYESRYEPAAVAYHVGGATTAREPARYVALQRRNQILLVLKNYPAGALVRHAPAILLHQAGWIAAGRRDGILRQHLAALASAASAIPATLGKRRAVQRARRITPEQLAALMSPEVYAGSTPGERLRSMARAAAPLFRRS
jgi:GT2 family glycosyltransferase